MKKRLQNIFNVLKFDKIKFCDTKGHTPFVSFEYDETKFVFFCKKGNKKTDIKKVIIDVQNTIEVKLKEDTKRLRCYLITESIPSVSKKYNEEYLKKPNIIIHKEYKNIFLEIDNLQQISGIAVAKKRFFELVNYSEKNEFVFPAIKSKLSGKSVYSFFASPKDLLSFSTVARRMNETDLFYQRIIKKDRIGKIRKFVEENQGYFPNNIILSVITPKLVKFTEFNSGFGNLYIQTGRIPDSEKFTVNIMNIVDGQHRLFACADIEDMKVPVLVLEGLNTSEERKLFLDINKEQKPIPSDLVWDLESEINIDSARGRISWVVKELNKKKHLPFFFGKIKMPSNPSSEAGIKITAFCVGILKSKIFDTISNKDKLLGYYTTFFKKISNQMEGQKYYEYIFGNAGIPILLTLYAQLCNSYQSKVPNKIDDFASGLSRFFDEHYIEDNEIKKLKSITAGESGRDELIKDIVVYLNENITSLDKFAPNISFNDVEFSTLERVLAKFIYNEFLDEGDETYNRYGFSKIMNKLFKNENFKKVISIFSEQFPGDTYCKCKDALEIILVARNAISHGRHKGTEAEITSNAIKVARIHCNSFFNITELKEIYEELYES